MASARRSIISTGLVIGATIVVLVAAGALLTVTHSNSAARQQRLVVSSFETIALMRQSLVAVQDAENSQRGFLLSGEAASLEPYERARLRVDTLLRQLEAAGDEGEGARQIAEFRSAAAEKLEELGASISTYQREGRAAAVDPAKLVASRATSDHIRQASDAFVEGQRLLLARRLNMLRSEQEQADLAGLLVLGGAFICLIAGTFLIVRQSIRLEETQRQLLQRSHLLQSTLETLLDPIVVLDAAGAVVAWNESFAHLAGWEPGHQPAPTRDFLLSERSPATRSLLSPLKLGEPARDRTMTARISYDGRDYEVSRGEMEDGGAVVRCVDITEELRDEAALRQGQKMEAIGQLTGGMAHDFNNILQVIQANLDLVRGDVGTAPAALARLQSAAAAAERGAGLTQQLLAFARRQPLEPQPTAVGKLVSGLATLLRQALGERVVPEFVIAQDAWNARIDPGQLENAILNLAINARDAMPEGGSVRVEVSNATLDRRYAQLHPDVTPGAYVLIDVSDTGVGMPSDVVAQAFDPFFTTKQDGKGTGLGLSMVYGFVSQSNGHIRIDSAIGQGTSVKLYLPRTLDPVAEGEGTPAGATTGSEQILVVEDNDDVRRAVVDMLLGWGYRVTAAENPDAAVTILEKESGFDLLFTDIVMPGTVSVADLIAMVRRLRPRMAILLTSGYARDLIPAEYRDTLPMIAKPYKSGDLSAKIRATLSARRSVVPAANPEAAPAAATRPSGRPRRILLVEDEVVLRMSTTDMLERLDCFVSGVGSGEQALELLERGAPYDLLVTDLGLPGMSGEDLAARVRVSHPGLPVIIASGYGRAAGQAEGVHFISKPYSSIDLQQALDHAARAAAG
jgi:signal transduction histidine kinase/DNA-binding response OmpR family regulator/CHASE3 domain sensor protein